MNEIINTFLLAGNNRDIPVLGVDHLLKTKRNKKKCKNSKKQKIHDMRIKMNYIKLAFNMTWLNEILKIYLEDQPRIKYYVIKHLISSGSGVKTEVMTKQRLSEQLHEAII